MTVTESGETVRGNRRFIGAAMRAPLLTREHEQVLARRWREQDDEAALHELVSAYMRMVVAAASKFRHYGLPLSDLVQEGCVGLMQAAARFEPEREVRFSTYAGWWIRAAMQEYILRNWSVVRTGTSAGQKSLFFNLRWMRHKIDGAGGGVLSPEARREISVGLKVSEADVDRMAMRLGGRDQSLNEPLGGETGEEWGVFILDEGPSPEQITIARRDGAVRSEWLLQALGELSEREQLIIRERKLRDERVTLEELGGRLGVTKERVRQIEQKAFQKLRDSVVRLAQAAGEPIALSGA